MKGFIIKKIIVSLLLLDFYSIASVLVQLNSFLNCYRFNKDFEKDDDYKWRFTKHSHFGFRPFEALDDFS